MTILEIQELYQIYKAYVETVALANFNTTIEKGEVVAVAGPSGSGKSTLLACVGGVLRPTSGQIFVENSDITKLNDDALVTYRRDQVGFIYQDFNLIDHFTIYENVALPLLIANAARAAIKVRVEHLLTTLGIIRYAKTYPPYISVGERQRVAIAIALANNPMLILADEPTGNLDRENRDLVLELLITQSKQQDKTLLVASHDTYVLDQCDRVIHLSKAR